MQIISDFKKIVLQKKSFESESTKIENVFYLSKILFKIHLIQKTF